MDNQTRIRIAKVKAAAKLKLLTLLEADEPESNYFLMNEDQKIEMHFDYDLYKSLNTSDKAEIKKYFLWSKYKQAWISKAKNPGSCIENIAKKHGLVYKGKEKRRSFESELERKKSNAERNLNKFETKKENALKRAKNLQSEFNRLRKDWSWLTQPIIPGHSGSQRFARSRQRVIDKYTKGFEEFDKAKYYEQKKQLAEEILKDSSLKNIKYIENRIKEANHAINKISKWVDEYNKEIEKETTTDERREKLIDWVNDGIENLKYNYDKLAYYNLAKSNLSESVEILFDRETVINLTKFIKKTISELYNIKLSSGSSQSYISIHNSKGLPYELRKSVALFHYPDNKERFNNPDFSIGNIMPTYISLSPKDWYDYLQSIGQKFN